MAWIVLKVATIHGPIEYHAYQGMNPICLDRRAPFHKTIEKLDYVPSGNLIGLRMTPIRKQLVVDYPFIGSPLPFYWFRMFFQIFLGDSIKRWIFDGGRCVCESVFPLGCFQKDLIGLMAGIGQRDHGVRPDLFVFQPTVYPIHQLPGHFSGTGDMESERRDCRVSVHGDPLFGWSNRLDEPDGEIFLHGYLRCK